MKSAISAPSSLFGSLAVALSFLTIFLSLIISMPPAIAAQTINVKSYGAKGDGVTDDQTAIQNAFNAASSSRATVKFPKGIYLHSSSLDANGIGIVGEQATLVATNESNPALNLSGKCSLSSMRIQSNFSLPSDPIAGLFITGTSTRTKISKVYVSGFYIDVRDRGSDTTISECDLNSDNGTFLFVADGKRALVSECTFRGTNGPVGVAFASATNTRVTECSFKNIATGVLYSSSFGGPSDTALFESNVFRNVTQGIRIPQFGPAVNLTLKNNQFTNGELWMNCDGGLVNVLIDGNRIVNYTKGTVRAAFFQDVRFSRNTIKNSGFNAVGMGLATRSVICDNTITNVSNIGILVEQISASLKISRNTIVNCGLAGAQAPTLGVILVGENGGNGTVLINDNSYRGNTQSLSFFIRSFIPATLTGNTTTTFLPSQVGP